MHNYSTPNSDFLTSRPIKHGISIPNPNPNPIPAYNQNKNNNKKTISQRLIAIDIFKKYHIDAPKELLKRTKIGAICK